MSFVKDMVERLTALNQTCTAEGARGVGTRGYPWTLRSSLQVLNRNLPQYG